MFVSACFTTDIIGSCAFGLECNSFKDPDSTFVKYGRRLVTIPKSRVILAVIANIFPIIIKIFRLDRSASDIAKFYYEIVSKTVEYREKNNYTRNDFLQLLMELKNNKSDDNQGKQLEKLNVVSASHCGAIRELCQEFDFKGAHSFITTE